MTQPMLDLKRLYWNCHAFRAGPRKQTCPYQALGLDLPTFDFWALLQADPRQLAQRLSTAHNTLLSAHLVCDFSEFPLAPVDRCA